MSKLARIAGTGATGVRVALLWTMLAGVSLPVSAQELVIGERRWIESAVLDEAREYWVALPLAYREGGYRRYPVLYLLDADLNSQFQVFSGMVRQMSGDASPTIPEMIVIGIVSQQRVRDSSPTHSLVQYGGKASDDLQDTGGADTFLSFVIDELIPYVDDEFATSEYRVFAGYSFSGLAVLQALFTRAEAFNAYIATDPSMWWDDHVMLRRAAGLDDSFRSDHRRLFVSSTHRVPSVYPDENYVIEFIDLMQSNSIDGLTFGSAVYGEDENHHTMPIRSFYDGLRFIFDGYMVDQGVQYRPVRELRHHFETVSKRLGATFVPREGVVNFYGYDRLYNDQFGIDVARAIEFFELNVEYYPESSNAWDSLAEGYRVSGQLDESIAAYRRSLALNPQNTNAAEKLRELENR